MPKSHGVGLVRWWCGLVGSGGCGFFGFYLEFRWLQVDALVAWYGSGTAVRWQRGLAGSGSCGFVGFWSSLHGGVGVCRSLTRKWGGGNGLYMRELNMCVRRLNMQGKGWAYKLSLRDSISRWPPHEKNAKSNMIKTLKPSL